MPVEWAGTLVKRERDFPLLVKFIFPEDKFPCRCIPAMTSPRSTSRPPAGAAKRKCGTRCGRDPARKCWWG